MLEEPSLLAAVEPDSLTSLLLPTEESIIFYGGSPPLFRLVSPLFPAFSCILMIINFMFVFTAISLPTFAFLHISHSIFQPLSWFLTLPFLAVVFSLMSLKLQKTWRLLMTGRGKAGKGRKYLYFQGTLRLSTTVISFVFMSKMPSHS